MPAMLQLRLHALFIITMIITMVNITIIITLLAITRA